ncbi:MAG: opacity family porin [Moraxella sp.]|nr:opacity family porin [Moraxella sp.]
MKKYLLLAIMASTSMVATANVNLNDVYVQGFVGASKLEAKFKEYDNRKVKDNDVSFGIAVGKAVGNVRYGVDYTNYGKLGESVSEVFEADDSYDNGPYTETTKDELSVKASSVGLSAIYDFNTNTAFRPYVGVRAGVNKIKREYKETTATDYQDASLSDTLVTNESKKSSKTKVGAGVLAGVQYQFHPSMALDVGAEYNHLGKIDGDKINQYGAKVGLRYNF